MQKAALIPVWVVSVLLALYIVLIARETGLDWAVLIFLLSPFAVAWMVYSVIRHDRYRGRELEADEEWGYTDRS